MNNIQTEIDELKATIAKLEAKQKEQNEPMFKRVEGKETYYALNNYFNAVNDLDYGYQRDNSLHKVANYFTDETVASRCSTFMKDRFWFIHKAIEFAEGYAFVVGGNNYSVDWIHQSNIEEWSVTCNTFYRSPSTTYMNEQQAHKFIEWLNKHKPEGL